MASPIGHSLAGCFFAINRTKPWPIFRGKELLLYMAVANAPDLDFIPGFIVGTPNLFHHGISHSLGAGLLFSILIAFFFADKWGLPAKRSIFFNSLGAYYSHLLLDYIAYDARPPIGIPVFWPLNDTYYALSHPILSAFGHSGTGYSTIPEFFREVFSVGNLVTIKIECLLIIPILVAFWLLSLLSIKLVSPK